MGAVNAANLDGGSSTQMILRGRNRDCAPRCMGCASCPPPLWWGCGAGGRKWLKKSGMQDPSGPGCWGWRWRSPWRRRGPGVDVARWNDMRQPPREAAILNCIRAVQAGGEAPELPYELPPGRFCSEKDYWAVAESSWRRCRPAATSCAFSARRRGGGRATPWPRRRGKRQSFCCIPSRAAGGVAHCPGAAGL